MFAFMGIFFPSVVGVFLLEKFLKGYRFIFNEYVYYYIMLCLFSNAICLVVSKLFFNTDYYVAMQLNEHSFYFVKYVLVAVFFNFILAIVFACIKRYIRISIEVEKKNDN